MWIKFFKNGRDAFIRIGYLQNGHGRMSDILDFMLQRQEPHKVLPHLHGI